MDSTDALDRLLIMAARLTLALGARYFVYRKGADITSKEVEGRKESVWKNHKDFSL